jgi:pilus assembly protein CpaE
MSHRLLLAIADPDVASQAAVLASEGEGLEIVASVDEPDEVARALRRHDVDVVVLHDALGTTPVLTLAREIAAGFPEVGLVLIAAEESPELLRAAMQAGLRDVVALPLALERFEAGVRAAAQWSRSMRDRVSGEESAASGLGGQLIAVAGSKGGVGTTTVAVQLALAAVRATHPHPPRPVCLVDFDLQTGDLRVMLDTPPRRSIADLVDVAAEITVRHLQETLYSHRAGVRLLLSPEEGWRGEDVTPDVARNVLDAVRSRHALTIVDVGSTLTETTLAAVEAATSFVVVTTPDILALRGVRRLKDLLTRVQAREGDDTIVLLNRTSRKLEVQPDVARRVVGGVVAQTTIPSDFPAFEPVVNTGAPERLTDQKVLGAFDQLAVELDAMPADDEQLPPSREGGVAPEAGRGGLLSRLTGERGQTTAEAMGLAPIIFIIFLAVWQIGLTGFTYVLAGHAAREGARELATDASNPSKSEPPYRETAREDIPSAWRKGAKIDKPDAVTVSVRLNVPMLLPGMKSPVKITSTAGTSVEDEPLPDSQKS